MENKPIKLFCSYSHKDEPLREELEVHAALLKRKELIEIWHDRKILPGKDWENNIDSHLENSEIILLLISPDFIASDYCYGKELSRAIERHESGQSVVIPIIVRPSDWKEAPFSKLQALPKDGEPVTTWQNRDEAWLHVIENIKKSVKDYIKSQNRSTQHNGLISLQELMSQEFSRLETIYAKEKKYNGLSTGFDDLDRTIDGIHDADFVSICGRPGMGRSDFAINIAGNIAFLEKRPISYFSLKHPAEQIIRRLFSFASRVDSNSILRGIIKEKDWPPLTRAAGILSELPLYIDDRTTVTIADIRNQVENAKKKSVVIIDSIQHLSDNEKLGETETCRKLKSLAKDLKTPIIGISSVDKGVEQRPNKRPDLRDLSVWHGLEEVSDVIVFLYRDEMYNYTDDNPNKGLAEIFIAKNNYGPTGTVLLAYLPEKSSFSNLAKHDDSAQQNN